jgi:D-serine deaminase-like pyridoxal phosphate-dependent protein
MEKLMEAKPMDDLRGPDLRGKVPTPALVVDVAAAERNHATALSLLGDGQWLRPHFKAHKTTALAALQHGERVRGVCCQTSAEALVLAKARFDDIMVTNQVVDGFALDELTDAARLATVSALVDDAAHVALLEQAARKAGRRIGVLIEIELGMNRCGADPDGPGLIELAAMIARSPGLTLGGIQAYDGHVAGVADPVDRRARAEASAAITRRVVERLRAAGHAVPIVAGCSTAHMPFVAGLGVWTDIQAGSYLLMDGAYGSYGDLPFEPALWLEATVIHASTGRFVLDGGLKQLAVDRGPPQWVADMAAATRLSDEHCVVVASGSGLRVGDRTRLLPRHVDPTVNLHQAIWLVRGNEVRAVAVDGRRAGFGATD